MTASDPRRHPGDAHVTGGSVAAGRAGQPLRSDPSRARNRAGTGCNNGAMSAPHSQKRRRRLSVDLPVESEAAVRSVADRYFRGVATDALRAALSLLTWTADERDRGRRVVAVAADDLPARYAEPLVPGLMDPDDEWTWLVRRPHPWRRQPFLKGTRIAAGDLARTIEIEDWTDDHAADEYGLPIEAVREAREYLVRHRELVLAEERENALAAQTLGRE